MIRQAIAATAESCCDGAVAAALFLCSRTALWAGAESVFAEELDQNLYLCLLVTQLVSFISYVFRYRFIFGLFHILYSATYSAFFISH